MPYRTIEQITTRGYEKVAPFLTVQQLFGVIIGLIPGVNLMRWIDGVLGVVVMLLVVLLSYLLTTEMDGMAPYERIMWHLRGLLRGVLMGTTLTPDDLPGVAVTTENTGISWEGGLVTVHDDPITTLPTMGGGPTSFPLPTLPTPPTLSVLPTNGRQPSTGTAPDQP